MEETRFKETFIANFISTWMANNYQDYCSLGKPDMLVKDAPIEDAECLAQSLWDELLMFGFVNAS